LLRATWCGILIAAGSVPLSCGAATQAEVVIDFEGLLTRKKADVAIELGPGASFRTNTIGVQDAHSGECYLEIDGKNDAFQYGFCVNNVRVEPNSAYDLSFFYRMTPNYVPQTFLVIVFEYEDPAGKGKPVANVYWTPSGHDVQTQWTEATRTIVTHEKARSMSVLFRQCNALPGAKLFLDDITVKKAEPTVITRWEIDPTAAVLSGTVMPSADILDKTASVSVLVVREDKTVRKQELKRHQNKFSFDLRGLEDNVPYYLTAVATLRDGTTVRERNDEAIAGRHTLKVKTEEGKTLSLKVNDKNNLFYTYVRHRPWEGNTVGILGQKDPPPAPWPPLACNVTAQTVTTWNNTITAGRGLGALRIAYAKPAQELNDIVLSLNGKPLSEQFRFSPAETTCVSQNRVAMSSTGTGQDAEVQTSIRVEFEGLIRHKIILRPAKGHPYHLNKLALTIGFPRNFVQYSYIQQADEWDCLTSATAWRSSEYHPTYYVGNFQSGILWCANRIYPSVRKQDTDWIILDSQNGKTVLTVNLVNQPMEVTEPLTVEFGLLPTPTRPFQAQARGVRFRSGEDATMDVCSTTPSEAVPYYGFPEFASAEAAKRYTAAPSAPRTAMLMDLIPGMAVETIPQVTFFKKQWIPEPGTGYPPDALMPGYLAAVDMGNSSWADLFMFKLKSCLERTSLKGYYFDCAFPGPLVKDGQCWCPVFESQDLHRRMCVLLHQVAPDGRIIFHQGGQTGLPWAAFSDFALNGEQLRGPLLKHSYYLEFMSMPEIRAMMCAPIGPAHIFLEQYWQPEKANNKALQSQVAALAMIHDSVMWVSKGTDILHQMMRKKYDFGDLLNATWYPYWEKNPYLACDNPAVICSFYERNGDLFAIIFNRAKVEQKVNLVFLDKYARMFPDRHTIRVYNPAAQKEDVCKVESGRLSLVLERYMTRLLTLKK
jgi:hypothetical protein